MMCKELDRYSVNIVAQFKRCHANDGQMQKLGSEYTAFWKGRTSEVQNKNGINFAIQYCLKVHKLSFGIIDRLLMLHLHM